jgi:hypothetical protein
MSWELVEFTLEETSGPVQVYNFEARLAHPDGEALEFRGDGIYMVRGKQLRLNREAELAAMLRERLSPPLPPYAPKSKLARFDAAPLVSELKTLLQSRVSAPPVVATKRRPVTATPTPAAGSVAYMLRWET